MISTRNIYADIKEESIVIFKTYDSLPGLNIGGNVKENSSKLLKFVNNFNWSIDLT